jgi:hypothetical protein
MLLVTRPLASNDHAWDGIFGCECLLKNEHRTLPQPVAIEDPIVRCVCVVAVFDREGGRDVGCSETCDVARDAVSVLHPLAGAAVAPS